MRFVGWEYRFHRLCFLLLYSPQRLKTMEVGFFSQSLKISKNLDPIEDHDLWNSQRHLRR